jgi:hypothetical protein
VKQISSHFTITSHNATNLPPTPPSFALLLVAPEEEELERIILSLIVFDLILFFVSHMHARKKKKDVSKKNV